MISEGFLKNAKNALYLQFLQKIYEIVKREILPKTHVAWQYKAMT